jgi:cytosine/adenosine deaminase-related metal-dependent hydrolase
MHLASLNDPVTTIVLNDEPSDVDTVSIDGEVVMRGGKRVGPLAERGRELIGAPRRRLLDRTDLASALGPNWAA